MFCLLNKVTYRFVYKQLDFLKGDDFLGTVFDPSVFSPTLSPKSRSRTHQKSASSTQKPVAFSSERPYNAVMESPSTIQKILALSLEIAQLDKKISPLVAKRDELENQLKKLAADYDGADIVAGDSTTPVPTSKQIKISDENLEILRHIFEEKKPDYDKLARYLAGNNNEPEKPKAYQRVAFFKAKGWMIKNAEGVWEVSPEMIDLLKRRNAP